MNQTTVEAALLNIIQRAEHAGRQHGISISTRSSKRSRAAEENALIASEVVRQEAEALVAALFPGDEPGFYRGGHSETGDPDGFTVEATDR